MHNRGSCINVRTIEFLNVWGWPRRILYGGVNRHNHYIGNLLQVTNSFVHPWAEFGYSRLTPSGYSKLGFTTGNNT